MIECLECTVRNHCVSRYPKVEVISKGIKTAMVKCLICGNEWRTYNKDALATPVGDLVVFSTEKDE